MGYIHADIVLGNPSRPELATIPAKALIDSCSLMLCIPEHVRLQLELKTLENREISLADGKKQLVPYVGPIEVRFEKRHCFVGALVLGDAVLLGAIPMQDMDLVVIPSQQRLSVNPESPNFPHALVK